MQVNFTANDLKNFEEEIVQLFVAKKILAPIHLDDGNEEQLIKIFSNNVEEDDWCCGSWRTHLGCLLKGVPPEELKQAILEGRSIGLCFPKYKIIASAIVGGILPISLGLALAIKLKKERNKVVCFLGDMTSETAIFNEVLKYATNHSLPLLFVLEDNNKSVCTNTREVWNQPLLTYEPNDYREGQVRQVRSNVLYYKYNSKFPHAGVLGERIKF